MIKITLPKFDFDINVTGLDEPDINNRATRSHFYGLLVDQIGWKKEGVYILYDSDGPIYVGRSLNLNERVCSHLVGAEASTREHVRNVKSVKGFFVRDICDQEIYEAYAIKTMKPKLNKAKTERIRGNYRSAKAHV